MNIQCIQISNQCNQAANELVSRASFMRKIQDYSTMSQHLNSAMDWTIHADLMLQMAYTQEPAHA